MGPNHQPEDSHLKSTPPGIPLAGCQEEWILLLISRHSSSPGGWQRPASRPQNINIKTCFSARWSLVSSHAQTRWRARTDSKWARCAPPVRDPPVPCLSTRSPAAPVQIQSMSRRSRGSGGRWTPSSSGPKRSAGGWRSSTQTWRTPISAKYLVILLY